MPEGKNSTVWVGTPTMKPAADPELRRRAEELLQSRPVTIPPARSTEEAQRLVHELEVHQIELEMQNAELRQARDEAETALDKYTDLYDFAPVGYLTLDRDGVIGSANLFIAGLLGIERGRLPGRRLGLLVVPSDRPAFTSFIGRVFSGRSKQTCELALLNYSGQAHFVQIEALAAASGLECRIAIIDISQRRDLEEQIEVHLRELATRADELAAANLELDAFNYTISHDLRTPLTIIHGYAQVVLEQCAEQLSESARGFIRIIRDSTSDMDGLLNILLEFSRATHVEIHRKQVDLSKMSELIAAGLEMRKGERKVSFRISPGIVVDGDPDLLRVVMVNLIGNAWKYSAQQNQAVIEFGVTEVGENPACYVRDNGRGFEMADAEKLFLPFQRLPGTTAEGHGVGLATVDRIIRRHGGRVWATSQPEKGATFYFTLE